MTVRATGMFTQTEIRKTESRLESLRHMISSSQRSLRERRAVAAAGVAKVEADQIETALDDEDLVEALIQLGRSVSVLRSKEAAVRRCPSLRGYRQAPTNHALEIRAARDAARKPFKAAAEVVDGLAEPYGLRTPIESADPVAGLRGRVMALRSTYQDGDLPVSIELRERDAKELEETLEAMRANRVSDDLLAQYANYLNKKQRVLLVRYYVDGYRPKRSTVDGNEDFDQLGDLGLLGEGSHLPIPTAFGEDLARWIKANLVEGATVATVERSLSLQRIRTAIGEEDCRTICQSLRDLLDRLTNREPDLLADQVEVGVDGLSIRVWNNAPAALELLKALSQTKRSGGRGRAVLRRRILSDKFVSGALVTDDE